MSLYFQGWGEFFTGWEGASPTPVVVVPVAIDMGAGPMGGVLGKQPEPYIDLADDTDESEVAQIAALLIRYFA